MQLPVQSIMLLAPAGGMISGLLSCLGRSLGANKHGHWQQAASLPVAGLLAPRVCPTERAQAVGMPCH